MDDLISRQAVIKAFEKRTGLPWEDLRVIQPMVIVLEDVPVVDVVEVIRCKDCMMSNICRYKFGLGDDGFCSQAERISDG